MAIGANLTKEALNIFFLLDTSRSMDGSRIGQLNHAMPEALLELAKVARREDVAVSVRIIGFHSGVEWILGNVEEGVDVDKAAARWSDLQVGGSTNTAGAIDLCLKALHTRYLGTRNYRPVVVLVTDGSSDSLPDMKRSVEKLKNALNGGSGKEKVIRIAVGVQDYDEKELAVFASTGTVNGKRNVPLVFKVDEIDNLSGCLTDIAVSSLYATLAWKGGKTGDKPSIVIDSTVNGDSIWQDLPE